MYNLKLLRFFFLELRTSMTDGLTDARTDGEQRIMLSLTRPRITPITNNNNSLSLESASV